MVTAVVAFNRGRSEGDVRSEDGSAQLLTSDQRASSFRDNKSDGKKKGIFGKIFKRKKDSKQDDEYEPPASPSGQGEDEDSPLNVTIMAKDRDPSDPYGVNRTDTNISDLTGGIGHRRVDFDPTTKQQNKDSSVTPIRGVGDNQFNTPSTVASEEEIHTTGTRTLEDTITASGTELNTVGTPSTSTGNEDVFTRTLGLFDDLCQVPKLATNLEPQLAAAMKNRSGDSVAHRATSTQGSGTKTTNTSSVRPEWGTVPSEDEDYDDDTFLNSMETTVDDSTLSVSRSLQTGSLQSSRHPSVAAAKNRRLGTMMEGDEVEDGQVEAPTHENFEVVLDSSFFDSKEPQSPKRLGWFSKKGKSDVEPESPTREHSNTTREAEPAGSEPRKQPAVENDDNSPDDVSSPKRPGLVGRLSAVIRKPKSNKEGVAEVEEEKKDDLDPPADRRIMLPAGDFDFVADENGDKDYDESLRGMDILHTDDERDSSDQLARQPLSVKPTPERKSVGNNAATNPKTSEAGETKTKESSNANAMDDKAKQSVEKEAPKPDTMNKAAKTKQTEKNGKGVARKAPGARRHKRTSSFGGMLVKLRLPKIRPRAQDDSQVKYGRSELGGGMGGERKLPKMPKPMWKAVEDPKSGRTYYYHRKTRETTWTKPAELTQAEKLIAQALARAAARKEANSHPVEISAAGVPTVVPAEKVPETSPVVATVGHAAVAENSNNGFLGKDVVTKEGAVSATKPSVVVQTSMTAESRERSAEKDNKEVRNKGDVAPSDDLPKKTSDFDDNWEVKKEISRLLTCLQPPDAASVNKLMKEYEGNEGQLLRRLRDLVESQPFDEPFLDEPALTDDERKPGVTVYSNSPVRESMPLNGRMRTGFTAASRTSATTRSSNKTQKISNTRRYNQSIDPIIENKSTMDSSISERGEDEDYATGLTSGVPERVPIVTRRRELKVEEFSDSRFTPETYDVSGRIVRGRMASDLNTPPEDQYYGDNEVDTFGTDSVSALSENDADYMNRKENFEHARRRALDDAIEREDWELAAALSEGIRPTGDYATAHGKWTQSEMDKFISQNDWSAVSGVIAQMRDGVKPSDVSSGNSDMVIPSPSANKVTSAGSANSGVMRAPSRGKKKAGAMSAAEKRIGSRSQLQHKELLSESSWTSESSYDSEYDSEYS